MNHLAVEERETMDMELTGPVAHVVIWRLNGATARDRGAQARQVVLAFEAMRCDIAGLLRMEVGANVTKSAQAWDLALYMVFASHADLRAYEAHPRHLSIKKLMAPMKTDRGQADFAVAA